MIAREWCRQPGCPRVAIKVFWSSVAVLEEPFHDGEEASTGRDPEARKGRSRRKEPRILYTGLFEQIKRPGGAVPGGGEDLKKRLDREPRKGGVRGKDAKDLYTSSFEQMWRSGGTAPGSAGVSERAEDRTGHEPVVVGEGPATWGHEFLNGRGGARGAVRDEREGSVGIRVHGSQNQRLGRKPAGKREWCADGRETSSAVSSEQQPWERGQASQACMHNGLGGNHPVRGRQARNDSGPLTSVVRMAGKRRPQ
jgi:hypothetical protein